MQKETGLVFLCCATVVALTFLRLWIQPTDMLIHNFSSANIFGLLPITTVDSMKKAEMQAHLTVAEALSLFTSD